MKMLKLAIVAVVVSLALTVTDQALCQWERDEARPRRTRRTERVDPAKAEEEYLQFLKENLPSEFKEMKDELEELKEDNPDAYGRKIQRGYRHMHRMQKMKEKDPERFENQIKMMSQERECRKLSREYRQAESAQEKEKIKAELTEILGKLFDSRLIEDEARVKALEEEISRLRERAAERKKNKDEIVKRRFEELTGEADDLRWQ